MVAAVRVGRITKPEALRRYQLRRRLQNLTAGSRKAGVPLDPGIVLKTGTRMVRQWRGHAHTAWFARTGSNMKASTIAH